MSDRSNLVKVIEIFTTFVQDAENTAADLYKFRDIVRATGVQLDNIGTIVGEARGVLADEDYRTAIITKIFLNSSGGEAEKLITMLLKVTDSPTVVLTEYQPAAIRIELEADNWAPDLQAKVKKAVAAGVQVVITNFTGTNRFRFDTVGSGLDLGQFSETI